MLSAAWIHLQKGGWVVSGKESRDKCKATQASSLQNVEPKKRKKRSSPPPFLQVQKKEQDEHSMPTPGKPDKSATKHC
jgi:hypothetical protein